MGKWQNHIPTWLGKIIFFEYWPWQVFYFPLYPYLIYLSIKHWNPFAFSAINSGISSNSGLINASKGQILNPVPQKYKPIEGQFLESTTPEMVHQFIVSKMSYPVIVKPDMGERGRLVSKVEDREQLELLLESYEEDYLVQEFLPAKDEFGVVFFKDPETNQVDITSVTQKEFLSVVGNGSDSIRTLLKKTLRGRIFLNSIECTYKGLLGKVVDNGQVQIVEPIGNHCRGTKFIDRGDLLNNATLNKKIAEIAQSLDNIHFGRIDLKVANESTLLKDGGELKVFEINGVHGEPSHIYDPKTNIIKAYRVLFKQWSRIYKVGAVCHEKGVPCLTLKMFLNLVIHKPKNISNDGKVLQTN